MSLGENGASLADIAAVANGGRGNGWGGDGNGWLFVLFLFAMCNGGLGNWGNGGMGGGALPYMAANADMQRGFDTAAISSKLGDISTQIGSGFADAALATCQGNANTVAAITGAKDAINNTLYANQLANNQSMNSIERALLQCCCDNKSAVADLKYTVATEACADRTAVSNGVRDIIANQTANTNAIIQSNERGFQAVQDKLCQLEIDNLKSENERLRTQLNMAGLAASQTSQTSQLQAGNLMQTQQILDAINKLTSALNGNNGCGCAAAC